MSQDTNETNQSAGQPSAAATGCDALLEWLKTEVLEDEGAMIIAREQGDWNRYHRLDGHRGAMVHVIHHIRAQHNTDYATGVAYPDRK